MTNVGEVEAEGNGFRKRKRTADFGITFESGYAEGWIYGVPPDFRTALDILNLPYVDKEKTKELRSDNKPDESTRAQTALKMIWTRGVPPALSFNQGDTFYRPAHVRYLSWSEMLKVMTHSIQIQKSQRDSEGGAGGWVEFEIVRYENGTSISKIAHIVSQSKFESILRTGDI